MYHHTDQPDNTERTRGRLTTFGATIPSCVAYPVTYGELRQRAEAEFDARRLGQAHRRNLNTALNAWMVQHEFSDDTWVGAELREAFDNSLEEHKRWLGERALSERTIRDRGEFLSQWQRIFDIQRQHDALPSEFSTCLALLVSRSNLTADELAKQSGLAVTRLRPWVKGEKQPWRGTIKEIAALESALGAPQGTLAKRLPARRLTDVNKGGFAADTAHRTDFQRRMSEVQRNALPYRLTSPSELMQLEWHDWLEHKTAIIPNDGLERSTKWRVKPMAAIGQRLTWAGTTESGLGCPTAQFVWSLLASYFGFLALSKENGGLGQPTEECQTLTLLADTDRLLRFIEWRRVNSENKMHRGIVLLVTIAGSLVRPRSGYLWQRPDWAEHFPEPHRIFGCEPDELAEPERTEKWHAWCEQCSRKLASIKKSITAVGVLKKARDAKDALGPVLSAERPVDVVLQMISVMEAQSPPASHTRASAVHARDILLLKLLISNPLRVQHFSTMVYKPSGRGNIYRTIDGAWRLRFDGSDFKNTRGAACDDYDVIIPAPLWKEIENYVSAVRPVLLGDMRSNYFFISSETGRLSGTTNPDGMWTGHAISDRVRKLWRIYMDDVPGYGPHGFRSIVATDYLKRFPGDYPNVARLLHDKLDTVLREYAHLNVEDGLRRLHAYVESYWHRDSA